MTAGTPRSLRFRPGLAKTAATAAVLVLTLAAAHWQTQRAEFKEALALRFDAREHAPLLDLGSARADPALLEFARVRVSGEFIAARSVLLDNRVYRGQAGYHMLTPLRIGNGTMHVLVNRGWVPAGASRATPPQISAPPGVQTVEGIAVVPPRRVFELAADATDGPVRQNLRLERLEQELGMTLQPLVIQQTAPAADGLVQDWPRPDFGIDKHRMYALQWYSFAALALVLYVALNLKLKR